MARYFVCIVLSFFFFISVSSQDQVQSAEKFQKELYDDYMNPKKSPLGKDAKYFEGLTFFEVDSTYIVEAKFTRTLNALPFKMKTSTSRLPVYEKYGEASFEIMGKEMTLVIYQSHSSRDSEEYKNHLFLPFTDLTNGEESYIGGRYLDLLIPKGDTLLLDFNKAYNPYCAYSKNYSCPIPPEENSLSVGIYAGVKKPLK